MIKKANNLLVLYLFKICAQFYVILVQFKLNMKMLIKLNYNKHYWEDLYEIGKIYD
jgi:hypothetical protein